MKFNKIAILTKNKSNNQFSLVLKARQLKKFGITPESILNLKLPKDFKLINENNLKVQTKNNLKGGKK